MAVPIPMTGIIAIIMQIVEIVLAGYTMQSSLGLLRAYLVRSIQDNGGHHKTRCERTTNHQPPRHLNTSPSIS
jgi:hypothetical protein